MKEQEVRFNQDGVAMTKDGEAFEYEKGQKAKVLIELSAHLTILLLLEGPGEGNIVIIENHQLISLVS
ncbi:hypothetical protein [Niallia taxi]|uniref:hypothetical protein n=1 Tax=Niallia taxi TaxID=2499688 RepID=UPI003D28FF92